MTRPFCKVIQISCGCMFWWFFFAMGHVVGLSSKTLWNLPSSSKNHIFTLSYIYIVLHSHVKSYIYIIDYINLYKYIYFYTYTSMECKSQTIYTHNTGPNPSILFSYVLLVSWILIFFTIKFSFSWFVELWFVWTLLQIANAIH